MPIHFLISLAELLYIIIMLVQTPTQILLGLVEGFKCVSLITTVILAHLLWITNILSKDTVALDSAMTSSLLMTSITRVWLFIISNNSGYFFSVGISIFRLLILIVIFGLSLLLFMSHTHPIIYGINGL